MSAALKGRALHYVLKIGDREASIKFYRGLLGMTPLRHEEFDEGCAATCNGPYDNKWSKTMIGYGREDENFVLELTYNYTVGSYELGDDLLGIHARLPAAVADGVSKADPDGKGYVRDPDGRKIFYGFASGGEMPSLTKVVLAASDLKKSLGFWNGTLGLEVVEVVDASAALSFGQGQAQVELVQAAGKAVDRGTGFGRTAFSVPVKELRGLEEKVKVAGHAILTPYLTLETPGKADVQVVIIADPDGHEICFVGDEGFRDLSKTDPNANELLDKAIGEDGSKQWYAKKGKNAA